VLLALAGTGCSDRVVDKDQLTKGVLNLSVDESFKPVIAEEVKIFSASFPDIKMNVSYKSESDCFRDLDSGRATMIITARGLTPQQEKYFQNKQSFRPRYDKLAYDAVAMIIQAGRTDSVYSLRRLKNLLTGRDSSQKIILDGSNETSTVRYMLDSVTRGEGLGRNVSAVKGSEEVIRYVSAHQDAIGFVGLSWVGNPEDPEQVKMTRDIRLVMLPCRLCADSNMYALPAQETIAMNQYPLVRPMFYILNENYAGVGSNFLNFLVLERGQLIFRRAYLVPAQMNFRERSGGL
jgi:phosphate transport system substrate-binding protein